MYTWNLLSHIHDSVRTKTNTKFASNRTGVQNASDIHVLVSNSNSALLLVIAVRARDGYAYKWIRSLGVRVVTELRRRDDIAACVCVSVRVPCVCSSFDCAGCTFRRLCCAIASTTATAHYYRSCERVCRTRSPVMLIVAQSRRCLATRDATHNAFWIHANMTRRVICCWSHRICGGLLKVHGV